MTDHKMKNHTDMLKVRHIKTISIYRIDVSYNLSLFPITTPLPSHKPPSRRNIRTESVTICNTLELVQ